MRRNNIPTSQSYQSHLIKDGVDRSGGQMYKEVISTGGRESGVAQTIGEVKVHPEGHIFPADPKNNKPVTYEKPHYYANGHISYDKGNVRSSNKYRGEDCKC